MPDVCCTHCGYGVPAEDQTHWTDGPRGDGYGHKGLCCDCMDLLCGMSLVAINRERYVRGDKPIERPWPGKDVEGNNL